MDHPRAILRRVPIFADLTDDDCDAVLRLLKGRRGNPKDVLFREGTRGDTMLVVVEGELVVRVRTPKGQDAEVARIRPGEFVGELAFLDAEERSATIATETGATVLEFSRQALLALRRHHPSIAATLHRTLLADIARRLRDVQGKLQGGGATSDGRVEEAAASLSTPGRKVTAAQLRTVPILAAHHQEDLELLAYAGTMRTFPRGAPLMKQGAWGSECFLLLVGQVDVTLAGATAPVATLGPGAIVGQLALLDRAPRSATVTATEETLALELRSDVFSNLVRAHSPLALRFQHEVAVAGARQLRIATGKYAEGAHRKPVVHDWHQEDSGSIELAVDPESIRH